jgi:ubiquinone/menaquinone biosynthesis C-methylase UbiE
VREVVALELSLPLIEMARRRTGGSVPVTLLAGSAEAIPLDDGCIDTVVTTWTLCTIGLPDIALAEMRRVLRRRGRLLFVEHGLAPDEGVRRWQNRVTPLWKRLSGGCHLNRPIRELIADNGFDVERLEVGYMAGLKIMSFTYEGAAVPS